MKKLLIIGMCAVLLSGCSMVGTNTTLEEKYISFESDASVVDLADSVAPAVVGVSSSDISGTAVGSGVCVAPSGYILTNAHVITNPNNISVYLVNGDEVSAKVVFSDSVQDIAVVKANATLPYLKLSDSASMVGEDVLAVGTPLSLTLKHTFTKGIVSALNRTIKVSTLSGEAYMHDLIQHDASINPGNSGGPLINMRGEVIGINTLKISGGEGIGFAIPAGSIRSLLGNLINDDDYVTPYLGVYGYDAEIANYYDNTSIDKGVYVLDVDSYSELYRYGVHAGDVIIGINERSVDNMIDLRNELYKYSNGDTVTIHYMQDGVHKMVDINLNKKER